MERFFSDLKTVQRFRKHRKNERGFPSLADPGSQERCHGIADSGPSGMPSSGMLQLAQTTGQAVADQSQGISLSQLTKQHRNKLRPACKSSRMSFRFGCFHQSAKFGAGEVMKKLIKQTSGQYHILALLFAAWLASALQRIRCGSAHYRRASSFSGLS
jgi:hypothetical protein